MHFGRKLLRFLAAGIPAFIVAIATNFLLVEKLHWPKPLAYLVVLWLQMTINFFACRILVFELDARSPALRQYGHFLSGNGMIRMVEWLFYTTLVEVFHVYYIAVQLMSIALFALLKFKFAESVFERRKQKVRARDLPSEPVQPS